jgi:hypothetical protein
MKKAEGRKEGREEIRGTVAYGSSIGKTHSARLPVIQ